MSSHGHAGRSAWTLTYKAWRYMRDRVKRDPNYTHVSICARWDNFNSFLEDMGERPEGRTLDRINNFKPYCKDNCRWATPLQQARNKTNNVKYKHHGYMRTLAEIAEITKIPYKTLFSRINQYGWSLERALLTPINVAKRNRNAKSTI